MNGEWAMVNKEGFALPIHYCPFTIAHSPKSHKPHKPDSVSKPSFIWPRHYCRDLAAYPGPRRAVKRGLGRAALERSYTWHYSTQGLPVFRVTTEDRELLPHIFTFSPDCSGVVIFCGTFSSRQRREPALNRWVALRCPDFPSRQRRDDGSGL